MRTLTLPHPQHQLILQSQGGPRIGWSSLGKGTDVGWAAKLKWMRAWGLGVWDGCLSLPKNYPKLSDFK